MSMIRVRDIAGNALELMNIRLSVNRLSSDEAYDDKFTDFAGNTSWPNPLPTPDGYTLYVNYANVFADFEQMSFWTKDLHGDIDIILNRTPLERITLSNQYYLNKPIKGESAFLDYYRYLRGESIKPLLEQSLKYGSNARRNFLMTKNTANGAGLPDFNPDDFGNDYYDRFQSFLDLYQSYGIYLYASVFPDNKIVGNWSNLPKQQNHWSKLGSIAQGHAAFFALELTNEIDAHNFNEVDPTQFNKIQGVLCCSGSRGPTGNQPMPAPQWDFCDFHQPRGYPSSVTDSCVANHPSRLVGKAVGLGEPLGFGKKSLNPNREENSRIAREIVGSAEGTAAFIFYHSQHGGFSQLYDDVEDAAAREFFSV